MARQPYIESMAFAFEHDDLRKHVAEKLPRINELLNEFSQDKKAAD
jgi:hypothetical protein